MDEKKKKIVFMGTPEFAAIVLSYVLKWSKANVVGVYTQPDKPCGRGKQIKCSAVKDLALKHNLPIFQPASFKQPESVARLQELEPDFLVVAAYGLILPAQVLDVPKIAPLNVHASLLPKYRGAAPIQRAILNGEKVTGITIMQMEPGMDTGPILLQRAVAIGLEDTAASLHNELAHLGGEMVVEAMEKFHSLRPILQDPKMVSYAPKLSKEEGLINFNRPVLEVHNQVRALFPWPGAFFYFQKNNSKQIKVNVYPGYIGPELDTNLPPGHIELKGNFLGFACKDKYYLVGKLKPANCKEMTAREFYCGFLSKCK